MTEFSFGWYLKTKLTICETINYFSLQTKGIHRVCVPHSSAVLATTGLPHTLCPAPGLHLLHAHPSGRRLPHRRSPYSHPHWFPRTVEGLAEIPLNSLPPDLVSLIYNHLTSLFCFGLDLCPRRRCCTCALCSTPSCLPSCGPSTASRRPLLRPWWTRTRQSFPPAPSSPAWSSGVGLRLASYSSWPTIKWWVLCLILIPWGAIEAS